MPAKATYLVRSSDGKMRAVIAHSPRGAVRTFADRYDPPAGEVVDVKERGRGTWESYKIS